MVADLYELTSAKAKEINLFYPARDKGLFLDTSAYPDGYSARQDTFHLHPPRSLKIFLNLIETSPDDRHNRSAFTNWTGRLLPFVADSELPPHAL